MLSLNLSLKTERFNMTQMFSLSFLVLFLTSTLFGHASAQAQKAFPVILGGPFVAADGEGWKFTARLVITKKDHFISSCSAILVGRRVLLTAAHCLKDTAAVKVVLGDPDETEIASSEAPLKGASYSTSDLTYKIHPDYLPAKKPKTPKKVPQVLYGMAQSNYSNAQTVENEDPFIDEAGNIIFLQENYEEFKADYAKRFREEKHTMFSFHESLSVGRRSDVAVIVLEDEVPEPFAPIEIWESQPELALKFGDELYTFGYGFHSLSTSDRDLALRFTTLNLVGLIGKVGNAQQLIGFSMKNGGPMKGDSGGPVAVKRNDKFYLIGINSAIGHDGHSMGTVPQTFLPWIQETIQELL